MPTFGNYPVRLVSEGRTPSRLSLRSLRVSREPGVLARQCSPTRDQGFPFRIRRSRSA